MKSCRFMGVIFTILILVAGETDLHASPYWAVFVQGGVGGQSGPYYGECHGPACTEIASAIDDVNIPDGAPFVHKLVYGLGGESLAYANLSTGKLGIAGNMGTGQVSAVADSMLIDTLRFDWEGTQEQQVQITIKLSGTYSSGSRVIMHAGAVPLQYIPGNHASGIWGELSLTPSPPYYSLSSPDHYGEALSSNWARTGYDTFTGTHFVTKNDSALTFSLLLMGMNNFDMQNSAAVSLTLPEGVSFTSDSGVFLSQTPVPIPAAVWLLGSGLVGLAAVRRKVWKQKEGIK